MRSELWFRQGAKRVAESLHREAIEEVLPPKEEMYHQQEPKAIPARAIKDLKGMVDPGGSHLGEIGTKSPAVTRKD